MATFRYSGLGAFLFISTCVAGPLLLNSSVSAQGRDQRAAHRQQTKTQWQNIGIGSGALGILGLLTGNKALAVLGIGGGLYSATRYEADRKSQKSDEHSRYQLFNRQSFDHNGHHYTRKTKLVKGHKYFYFQKSR